ncbi:MULTISPECIES: hypothetical protein [Arenibacter]|uniref:hypothetical protein n=1 Tax=Arenibacter TaxID=178469 RepID=UPI0012FFE408|nr:MULTISPECIES: hypothetical protein [Arenibacter]
MNPGIEVKLDILKKFLGKNPVGLAEVDSADYWDQNLIGDLHIALNLQVPTLKI